MPTSAKDKAADADAAEATPDDIETFGDEVQEHICPSKSSSDFDNPFFLIEDDVPEVSHRYLDAGS